MPYVADVKHMKLHHSTEFFLCNHMNQIYSQQIGKDLLARNIDHV